MDKDWARVVAKNIRRLRKDRHMSQGELASILGITGKHLGRIERGERNPTLEMVAQLCKHFGLSESYFYQDASDRSENVAHMCDPLLEKAIQTIPRMTPAMRRNLEALFALWDELDKPDEGSKDH